MVETKVTFFPKEPLIALLGNPNSGKTALFNLLTGGTQKVANYAGVTVERKEGKILLEDKKFLRLLDLPGVYSLYPRSLDEQITCDVLMGRAKGEKRPDLVVCVLNATNLRRNLRLVLAVKRMGLPCIVVLNMMDLAISRGLEIDQEKLSIELQLPVVSTIGIKTKGDDALRRLLSQKDFSKSALNNLSIDLEQASSERIEADNRVVQGILQRLGLDKMIPDPLSDRLDQVLLHPVLGPCILLIILFLVFQAVFSWANLPMEWLKIATEWTGQTVGAQLPDNWLRSLIMHGVIAGAGAVLIFLPQILILFLFIIVLEESGYLPRAAYLLDRLMGGVGLSGRSFIPLLSSFACAIPGIMATRTITNARDRLVTILIAPLMTCSARLPVYSLIIAAFIPAKELWLGINLQGFVLFILYLSGILGALLIAWLLKIWTSQQNDFHPLMMELPEYHLPRIKNVLIGLWQRAMIFIHRVGSILMLLTIGLWFLASYPTAPLGASQPDIEYSFAGMLGKQLAHVFAPLGFNWEICIALIPGLAAREVVVSALGTVYAISTNLEDTSEALLPIISGQWSLATALSLLAWFVFAPQCLSTIAAVKRETGNYRVPLMMLIYLFTLAYLAAYLTYQTALFFGLG